MFIKIDYDQRGVLDEDNLRWGFRNYGIRLLDSEVRLILQTFDKNGNGVLEYNEMLEALNSFTSEQRKQSMRQVYSFLSAQL